MKITTWNVNGLRARLTHVVDFLRTEAPDVLCLQETKVEDAQFPRAVLENEGYEVEYWGQKGYNGVAILAQHRIESPWRNLPDDPVNPERRVLGARVRGLQVLDLYVPNGQEVGSDKYRYKLDWLRRLRMALDQRCAADELLVVVGDCNVALDDRDVHDPARWRGRILCSDAERTALRAVLAFPLVDLLRQFHAEGGIYTWWDYRANAAATDQGLRIDYIFGTKAAAERCTRVVVHKELRTRPDPSDHVPVSAWFRDEVGP